MRHQGEIDSWADAAGCKGRRRPCEVAPTEDDRVVHTSHGRDAIPRTNTWPSDVAEGIDAERYIDRAEAAHSEHQP